MPRMVTPQTMERTHVHAHRIERHIGDAAPEIELHAPEGELAVAAREMGNDHGGGEERKGLEEIALRPLQPRRHAGQGRHRCVP